MRALAGYIAAVREKMRDELTNANVELELEDGEIAGHVLTAVDDVSALIPKVYDDTIALYAAADDDYLVDDEDISAFTDTDALTLLYNSLAPARNITFDVTDTDNSITEFTFTLVGKDVNGTAQTEIFHWYDGLSQKSELLWSYMTSATFTTIAGVGEDDTIKLGYGPYIYNGLTIRLSGPTTVLDLSTYRDRYGQEYFKDMIGVREVEYPINTGSSGAMNMRNFSLDEPFLNIRYSSGLTASSNIRIKWAGKHKVTFDTSTIPARLEEIVVLGAVAHAFSSMGSRKIDMVNIGAAVPGQLRDIAMIKSAEFEKKLRAAKPVRVNQSYSME